MRVMIGIGLLIAAGVALIAGLNSGGLADRDVLLIAAGAGLALLGVRMLVKGALRMVLLVAAIVVILAGPLANLVWD